MSSRVRLEVASNQLAQDLSQIVNDFTLLDILSKEEQETFLEKKILDLRKKNEERMRRHQEIEEDKRQASSMDGSTPNRSSPLSNSTTPPLTNSTTPPLRHNGQLSTSQGQPADSGNALRTAATQRPEGNEGDVEIERQPKQDEVRYGAPAQKEPSSIRSHTETIRITLRTTGTGLGFGVLSFPGIGVTIKTIVPDGIAGKDGRLHSGDLLKQINNSNVENKSLDEVYTILKECQGDVDLIVSREIIQVPQRPVASNRRDGPRRGPAKEVPSRSSKDDLTISVEAERTSSGHVGRGRGRGRERTNRTNREGAKQKEYEEKRKENFDRVEAEIAAMREVLETQKAEGSIVPPTNKSVYSFLDDPSRFGMDSGHEQPAGKWKQPGGRGGARRKQQGKMGPGADNRGTARKMEPAGSGQGGPQGGKPEGGGVDAETATITMTGKERQEYEEWKRERKKIDQQRIQRHQRVTAENQRTTMRNEETSKVPTDDWGGDTTTTSSTLEVGHWDSTLSKSPNQADEKTADRGCYEHDDRTSDQSPTSRIGSGRFDHGDDQPRIRGRGGGRGFYRGGRSRGSRGSTRGGGGGGGGRRPGRQADIHSRDPPLDPGDSPAVPQEEASNEWQQQSGGSKWDQGPPAAGGPAGQTEAPRIGPLPSPKPAVPDDVKSLSPFSPTGHSFLVNWAAEMEAYNDQQDTQSYGADLVYSNSNVKP